MVAVATLVLAAGVAVALALGGGGSSPAPTADGGQAQPAGQGKPLPDLEFRRFRTEEAQSLHDHLDKPLVINFFASWCRPCLAEMPRFEQVHRRVAGRVNFLGMNLQDNPSSAQRVITETGITYPVGVDPQGRIFQALGGFGMPTTVFVQADGTIAERFTGELSGQMLMERLRRHGFIP